MNYHKFFRKELLRKKESGITLIALIVTIIILVILASVAIRAAYNSGIIDYSVNGTQNYIEGAANENRLLMGWESYLESVLNSLDNVSPHPDQVLTKDVGIDARGNPVNLDLWLYSKVDGADDEVFVGGDMHSTSADSRLFASSY